MPALCIHIWYSNTITYNFFLDNPCLIQAQDVPILGLNQGSKGVSCLLETCFICCKSWKLKEAGEEKRKEGLLVKAVDCCPGDLDSVLLLTVELLVMTGRSLNPELSQVVTTCLPFSGCPTQHSDLQGSNLRKHKAFSAATKSISAMASTYKMPHNAKWSEKSDTCPLKLGTQS